MIPAVYPLFHPLFLYSHLAPSLKNLHRHHLNWWKILYILLLLQQVRQDPNNWIWAIENLIIYWKRTEYVGPFLFFYTRPLRWPRWPQVWQTDRQMDRQTNTIKVLWAFYYKIIKTETGKCIHKDHSMQH